MKQIHTPGLHYKTPNRKWKAEACTSSVTAYNSYIYNIRLFGRIICILFSMERTLAPVLYVPSWKEPWPHASYTLHSSVSGLSLQKSSRGSPLPAAAAPGHLAATRCARSTTRWLHATSPGSALSNNNICSIQARRTSSYGGGQ
jgi:hypothetical protein